ncbi:MAG TPA: hypothetical protein VIK22_07940 [Candidatus Anoxymicrobiaceae bacterium]
MRKTTAIVAILAAAALALTLLAGCGGDEKQARTYIMNARKNGKTVSQNQAKLMEQANSLNKYAGIQNPTPQDYAAMQQFTAGLVTLVDAINESAQQARGEFEKVLDLKGVDKYKKYAEIQIEELQLVSRRSNLVNELAAIMSKVLQAEVTGVPLDATSVKDSFDKIIQQRNDLTKQIEKLNEQAITLAQELGLE